MEQKLSYHAHVRDLIRDKKGDELLAFLDWSYRRQVVVSRSKKGLPWVSRKALAEAAQERKGEDDLDLVEGEELSYTLVHKRTQITIAQQTGRPFTIDQAMALGAQRKEINLALTELVKQEAQHGRRRRRSRARAPT
jgi:hypothetical protein